jgi:regulator of replication initiation timing
MSNPEEKIMEDSLNQLFIKIGQMKELIGDLQTENQKLAFRLESEKKKKPNKFLISNCCLKTED